MIFIWFTFLHFPGFISSAGMFLPKPASHGVGQCGGGAGRAGTGGGVHCVAHLGVTGAHSAVVYAVWGII